MAKIAQVNQQQIQTVLTTDELDSCKRVYQQYDKEGTNFLDVKEVILALQQQFEQYQPEEEDVQLLISSFNEFESGYIDFKDYIKIIEQIMASKDDGTDQDLIEVYQVLGGSLEDEGKLVSVDNLTELLRQFGLKADVDKYRQDLENERTGFINYEEFKSILKANHKQPIFVKQ